MLSYIKLLISPATKLLEKGVDYADTKQKIKAAKQVRADELAAEVHKSKIKSIELGDLTNAELDKTANQRMPWADDLTYALWLIPIPLAFFPSTLPHVIAGFEAIGNFPKEYTYSLGMMMISVFGYRKLVLPIVETIISKSLIGRKH